MGNCSYIHYNNGEILPTCIKYCPNNIVEYIISLLLYKIAFSNFIRFLHFRF